MTRDELKEYFKRGKIPTENNFSDLIDFSTYSHKQIVITNTEDWTNFINNYIVNTREEYANGVINGDIINGYVFVINGNENITFYIDRNINFINCIFINGNLDFVTLNFEKCYFYNCIIHNKNAIINKGSYFYSKITSNNNLSNILNILYSTVKLGLNNDTLSVSSLSNSYIIGGTITFSRSISSIVDAYSVSGLIYDSKCIIKNAKIDGLKFGSNVTWIDLINCSSSIETLFDNSDINAISGNIYGCNFASATTFSVILKGVHSCKLKSTITNQCFADTFGEKGALEYGDNVIVY